MKSANYTYTCECEKEIDFQVSPGRPAPPCSNHDSPAFSDSGDPAEIEGPDICPNCGVDLDLDSICDEALEKIDWSDCAGDYREDDDR